MSPAELMQATVYYLQQFSPFMIAFFVLIFAEKLVDLIQHAIFSGDHD